MTPPLLLEGFSSPVAFAATAGIYTAARLPTLAEAPSRRLPIPPVCVCPDGTCLKCYLRDDRAFELSQQDD